MSSQNRFLLPQSTTTNTSSNITASSSRANDSSTSISSGNNNNNNNNDFSITTTSTSSSLTTPNPESSEQDVSQFSVDTDFDSYWEEEARNPHRNRIRIGRQYQATVPPLLKVGEKDQRKLEDLETLSFCPKKSARVSDAELDHYFTVAKSLNLFASLVETRSLLGRDVTIADLNHIRHKEGLSLASVIQPVRQQTTTQASTTSPSVSPLSSQQSTNIQSTHMNVNQQSPQKSPQTNCDRPSSSSSTSSKDQTCPFGNYTLNQPLMKALSHFINLHHPCHHDQNCKKMLKEIPLEGDSTPAVSITAGNLRQGSSSSFKEAKPGRSRSSLKQAVSASLNKQDESEKDNNQAEQQQQQQASGENIESPSYEDWTREEVELFSKAIEVCGKNFSSIKKEFLPSKSVKSIVEYYYIGSRDVSESKKKSTQNVESGDGCSSHEKSQANNNGQGGGGGGGSSAGGKSSTSSNITGASNPMTTSSSRTTNSNNDTNSPNKTLSDATEEGKQTPTKHDLISHSKSAVSKNLKSEMQDTNGIRPKAKNIDPRMSVYNFDEEFKEDSPVRFDCPKPGTEVKPLKAKPIIPNASLDSEASNSNVGSLKFFMDGQLVLKLNACQDQQEGNEKCHWVQSGDKVINSSKQKRYTKKAEKSLDSNQNGSKSNSVVSSYQDDDSTTTTKNDDLTGDEDSKESMNSFTNLPQNKSNHSSPNQKRLKVKSEPNMQQSQLPSPINYNRLAVNNRIKERNDNLNSQSPVINQAMPWLQANHLAVAAALLGQLPFPPTAGNMMDNSPQNNVNNNNLNMATKPMDLSLEHSSPKSIQKSTSRSRGRSRNN